MLLTAGNEVEARAQKENALDIQTGRRISLAGTFRACKQLKEDSTASCWQFVRFASAAQAVDPVFQKLIWFGLFVLRWPRAAAWRP